MIVLVAAGTSSFFAVVLCAKIKNVKGNYKIVSYLLFVDCAGS